MKSILIEEKNQHSNAVSFAEYIINVFILYFLSGALLYLFGDDNGTNQSGSASVLANGIWLLIYMIIVYLAKENFSIIINSFKENKFLIILSVLVLASALWSQAPAITLRRSISYVTCLLYSFYLNNRFRNNLLINLFFYVSVLIAFSSLVFIILFPKYGVANGIHSGAWQGVYFHKNGLGRISGLCSISSIIYIINLKKLNVLSIITGFLCLILLVMSKSSTSLISFLFIIPIYFALRWTYRKYSSYKIIFNLVIIVFAAYFLINSFDYYSKSLFNEFGKDDSFSGRAPLWAMLLGYVNQSPIYGYGYSAFWIPKLLSKSLWVDTSWAPEQGHNGFIDITLELGLIGLALFIIILVKAYKRSISSIKNNVHISSYWHILTLVYLTVVSFTESFILKYNNVYWLMLLLCCINVNRDIYLIVRGKKHPLAQTLNKA